MLQRLLSTHPRDAISLHGLGAAHLRLGALDEASESLQRALQIDPTLVVALNSDLANPGQVASGSFSEAVNASNGEVRVWRSGSGDGGGNDGGEGGLVNVNFRCDNGVTQMGDSVYAVGNVSQLGNWSPASAVRLTDTSSYPTWKGSIALQLALQAMAVKSRVLKSR